MHSIINKNNGCMKTMKSIETQSNHRKKKQQYPDRDTKYNNHITISKRIR